MEIISYNHELEYANLLFSKLFRNIKIQKFYKNTLTVIPVNCIIGNRWRIFKNMENPEKMATYKFPLIVISRRGLQVEPDRIANLHNEIKWFSDPNNPKYYDLMTPVPVAISYDVTIISKDQGTNDMIMSNFIPFFNQDLFVSSIHPKFTNVKFNNQVIMGNTITEEHPDELANTDDDFVINTCNFTYKTYLFGGKNKAKAGSNGGDGEGGDEDDNLYDGFVPIIKSIMLDIHAVPFKDPLEKSRKYNLSSFSMKPRYIVSCDKTSCSCETSCSCDRLSGEICWKKYPIYAMNEGYDPYFSYSIEKYFKDVAAGLLPSDVDTLRWHIDERTDKFKLDRYTKFDSTSAMNVLSGLPISGRANALSNLGDKISVDYPGEMWEYGMDPLSGFRNVGLSSAYVPINKKNNSMMSCECGCQYYIY